MSQPAPGDPALFVLWERVLGDILDRTAKFPRSVRFTLSSRIDNAALDILEELIEARYASGALKAAALATVDRRLTRLRVLLRVCHERGHLAGNAYEHVMRGVDEAGRMVGGWRRHVAGLGRGGRTSEEGSGGAP